MCSNSKRVHDGESWIEAVVNKVIGLEVKLEEGGVRRCYIDHVRRRHAEEPSVPLSHDIDIPVEHSTVENAVPVAIIANPTKLNIDHPQKSMLNLD